MFPEFSGSDNEPCHAGRVSEVLSSQSQVSYSNSQSLKLPQSPDLEALNAFNKAMWLDLRRCFEAASEDPDIRCAWDPGSPDLLLGGARGFTVVSIDHHQLFGC